MDDLELIAPQPQLRITFAAEPVYNLLCSLILLGESVADSIPWARQAVARLTPEHLQTNDWVTKRASRLVSGESWPSFPAWLDDLATRDPDALRDLMLEDLLRAADDILDGGEILPSTAELLADPAVFVSLLERVYDCKGHPRDRGFLQAEYDRFTDPAGTLAQMVTYLRAMWHEVLEEEWARNLPVVEEAVAAFSSVPWSGRSTADIVAGIVARDTVPAKWESWLPHIEELVFIPSTHIGPYLLVVDRDDTRAWIVFGARVPAGATIPSPALTRSELLTRLAGLADDTRLRLLKVVADRGEIRAGEIMDELGISQSSASRQLRELVATGYLRAERCEGANVYRLNRTRIGETLDALDRYLAPAGES